MQNIQGLRRLVVSPAAGDPRTGGAMVEYGGYAEEDLISNRSALLLYGGNEEERRAWAYEAGAHFASEGSVVEARTAEELQRGLEQSRGIGYIPDVLGLGLDAQSLALRCLQEREGRP